TIPKTVDPPVVSADGKQFAIAPTNGKTGAQVIWDGTVVGYSIATGKKTFTIQVGPNQSSARRQLQPAFAPDGKSIAVWTGTPEELHLYSLPKGELLARLPRRGMIKVHNLLFLSDNKTVLLHGITKTSGFRLVKPATDKVIEEPIFKGRGASAYRVA